MDVSVFLVMTDGAAPDNGGTVLTTTDEKKVKALTISTKNPYYADKITLKKGVTSLYAGDTDKIVATVDFGKNTTYTTYNNIADYLEVVNVHTEEGKLDDYIIRVKAGKHSFKYSNG